MAIQHGEIVNRVVAGSIKANLGKVKGFTRRVIETAHITGSKRVLEKREERFLRNQRSRGGVFTKHFVDRLEDNGWATARHGAYTEALVRRRKFANTFCIIVNIADAVESMK